MVRTQIYLTERQHGELVAISKAEGEKHPGGMPITILFMKFLLNPIRQENLHQRLVRHVTFVGK